MIGGYQGPDPLAVGLFNDAREPLSTGTIQRRVAREGLDVATGTIEAVGEQSRETHRVAE